MPASIGTPSAAMALWKVIGAYAQQGRLLEASRWLGPLDFSGPASPLGGCTADIGGYMC